MSNTGTENPLKHPLKAASEIAGSLGVDPRAMQRASLFQGANDGPAITAAKITGVIAGHQREGDGPYFTNNEGAPWPDPAHSLNIGGIPVISDTFLMQKQQTFNRSKTLERKNGSSLRERCIWIFRMYTIGLRLDKGIYKVTMVLGEPEAKVSIIPKAHFLQNVGQKTPVFVRFSTVTFGKEFPDEGRNPRGFAIKFYTGEGNYDIVGLNWPIFFCRDPIQGPDVIRSQQRNPANFLLDFNSLFDFLANVPESNHAGMMFFSDHGTPVGWRFNHGYGCHTFKWVNAEGKFVYIKYHFRADHGQKQFTWPEAVKMSGEDPDFSKRDLWEAIENGTPVTWTACYQVMTPEEADPALLGFDPFDVTKVWPRKQFPLHEFGKLVLNKNPENYHRDVEQAAFSPGSFVPGIEASPDMLLQFRTFFYRDAQYHRLGVNLHQVPVNCPFMASSYSSINFDGPLRADANTAGNPHYVPNSFVNKFSPDKAECPIAVADNILSRQSHHFHEGSPSEYDQARELYLRVMSSDQRERLHSNTAVCLKWSRPEVQQAYLAQCWAISPDYAKGIYQALPEKKIQFEDVEISGEEAAKKGKCKKFMPSSNNHRLVGKAVPVYISSK
ncbi:hypothetical protein TWF730_002528 [Orbilia blumenaviensis]|uniref:Catalase core domain-containing protein n=1 Tax=Orbilia blumenaviensis TaxID=1796055 RepID=A0AAV9UA61_9PEZI